MPGCSSKLKYKYSHLQHLQEQDKIFEAEISKTARSLERSLKIFTFMRSCHLICFCTCILDSVVVVHKKSLLLLKKVFYFLKENMT